MFCKFCGEKIEEESVVCPKCGARLISNGTISGDTSNNEESKITNAPKAKKELPDKTVNILKKCCLIGLIAGIAGVAIFIGIVLIGLIVYGKVYLFHGYGFTKVLTIISIVLMIIGLCSVIAKCILNLVYKIGNFPKTAVKKALLILLAVTCLGCSLWGFVDCGNRSNFIAIYIECNCSSPWAKYGTDYLSIDTNPYDYDSDLSGSTTYQTKALTAIRLVNNELDLPSYLYQDMLETRALDGKQSYSGTKVDVSWRYHPDSGLEVRYTKK